MNKFRILSLLIFLSFAHIALQAEEQTLQLKDIAKGVYTPQYIYGVRPMADGETYSQLSNDRKRIIRRSFKDGKEVGTLLDLSTARGAQKIEHIEGYILSPDEKKILIQTETKPIYRHSFTAVYYIYDTNTQKYEPLSNAGPQQIPTFSPDGNLIAFVRDNNIFLVKLLYGNAESQVTKDGKRNEIINGIPDWVNEEEFSTSKSLDFSADSKMLAWIRYDESKVPIYNMQMWKGLVPSMNENDAYPGNFSYKYPVAGATNASVSVHSFDIKNRVTRKIDVPLEADGYIPRIKFTNDPNKLAVVTLNRHQNQMDIYMANPRSTVCKLALRENAKKYIRAASYASLKFYDNHFTLLSDRSGYQHIYFYTLDGRLERQVTSGNFDITDFYGYNASTKTFYYASHEQSPLRKAVYATDAKGKKTLLTKEVGTNNATFSSTMQYFMNVYSSAQVPPVTSLYNNKGKQLTTLVDNASLRKTADEQFGIKEFFSFQTSEGVTLNGWMVKPRNFDANKKYPVIMYQYSGPGSQEVTDSWNLGFMGGGVFESYMTEQGYIYVCVDGRGTGGRGVEFEQCTYMKLGDLESKDQVETALYLSTLPYIDGQNIGIWGWSFGGFNTLMSMTDGRPVFKAGVAIAAPTNWKYYDTVYTERFMRTPQENAEGYAINPIQRAHQLSGELLLIHGTADDNVHLRNAFEMSEALVQANKQFDMQIYTNRNHSIFGGNTRFHLVTRMCNFFHQHLK